MLTWIAPLKPFISALVLPPGLFLLLLALGLLLQIRRHAAATAVLAAGVTCAWLGNSVAMARWMQTVLLDLPPALTTADITRLKARQVPTAIVVLGGGLRLDAVEYGGQTLLNEFSFARLHYGVWLGRQTGLPLAYSGGVGWGYRAGATPEAVAAGPEAAAWGQPLRWVEAGSRDTRENARNTLPLLQADGIREVVLVTEAAHMPRALRAFTQAAPPGLRITPAPTAFISASEHPWLEWLPSTRGQRLVSFTLHEWLGLLAGA